MSNWMKKDARLPGVEPDAEVWEKGQLRVIVSVQGRHLSISHRQRYPHWDEIREARYRFLPDDLTMCMIFPPRREYVNLHKNCFHLHEHADPKSEGRIVLL